MDELRDKEWLEHHYIAKHMTMSEIASMLGCTRKSIAYWLKKFDIASRGNSDISEETRKKMSNASKGRIPFSKGLTKDTHPSIQKISEKRLGSLNPSWKGGKYISSTGYVLVLLKKHPHKDKDGYVYEHRLVMEEHIGRLLDPAEVVHHRDFNRKNNSIANLFLFPSLAAHISFHNYKQFKDATITEEKFMEEIYNYE